MRSGSGAFFDGFAVAFDTFYDSKRNQVMRWIDQRFRRDMFIRAEMTFELLGDLKGKSVLDIGCGSGFYIANALRRGAAHVTGIDPAPAMLALARQRAADLGLDERVSLVEGYFPQVSPAGSFDFAIVMGVLDYVEDPIPFLEALRRLIGIGASISFPSRHGFRTPLRKVRYWLRKCPVVFYSSKDIEALMRKSGIARYRVTKIDGAGMDYVVWIEA